MPKSENQDATKSSFVQTDRPYLPRGYDRVAHHRQFVRDSRELLRCLHMEPGLLWFQGLLSILFGLLMFLQIDGDPFVNVASMFMAPPLIMDICTRLYLRERLPNPLVLYSTYNDTLQRHFSHFLQRLSLAVVYLIFLGAALMILITRASRLNTPIGWMRILQLVIAMACSHMSWMSCWIMGTCYFKLCNHQRRIPHPEAP
jgi:hypothetical protein